MVIFHSYVSLPEGTDCSELPPALILWCWSHPSYSICPNEILLFLQMNFPLCIINIKVLSLRRRLRMGLWESGCRRVQIRCRPKVLCGTEWLGDISFSHVYMRVSINGGSPKWMVYYGKSLFKWMIWGFPHFRKPPYLVFFTGDGWWVIHTGWFYYHNPYYHMGLDQYLLIPFLGGWTSIYQQFWGSLGTRVLTHCHIRNTYQRMFHVMGPMALWRDSTRSVASLEWRFQLGYFLGATHKVSQLTPGPGRRPMSHDHGP